MPNLNSIRFCKTRQISLLIILFVLQTNNLIQAQRTQQQKEFIQSLNLTPEESEWLNNNYIIKVHPDSWPPFNYWDMRTGTNQGICIEYLRWIAIKTGIQFEFPAMWMPFKHILPALEHKQLDLSPSIHKTTERENYLLYSKPIHPVEIWLFAASNEQYSPDLLRQPGIRITCEDQTKTHEYLSATYPNLIIIPTITEEDGLRKVISHEADFHAGSKSVCNYLIKNYYGLNNLTEIHRLEFPSQGIYMAAREDWPELISIINKSLDQLPASTKDEIIDNYINQIDWEKYQDDILLSMALLILILSITAILLLQSITKQKAQQKQLLQDDLKLQQASDTAGLFFMEYDIAKKLLYLNAKTALYLMGNPGITQVSLKSCFKHIYKVDREVLKSAYRYNIPGDGKATRLRLLQANGQLIYLNCFVNWSYLKGKNTLLLSCIDVSREVFYNTNLLSTQRLAHIGHFRFDPKQKKYHLSEETCRILGLEPVALTLSLTELLSKIPKAYRHEYFPELKNAIASKANDYKTTIQITYNNQYIHFINRFLYNDIGKVILHEGYIQDISDLKQTELLLEDAKNQAEKANKAKSAFLARMSHEIRTPLNAIIGMLNLSLKSTLNKSQNNYLCKAFSASEMLLKLINDILDFSKIEANKSTLNLSNFNIHQCLTNTINILTPKAHDKNLKLTLDIDDQVCNWIYADELRLKQILVNLINNAIKFTHSGGIRVTVKSISQSGTDLSLHFSVKDSGIGIAQDKIEILFQSFMQVDDSLVRQFEGSGLGLAICKGIVKLWNGKIWVDSIENKGSTFHFTLPAAKGIAQTVKPTHHRPKTLLSRPKILLAEDNLFNQEIAEEIITGIGADITVVNDGIKALEHVITGRYDIIFMDIHMPKADGITSTRLIRKHFSKESLPIIAVSADALIDNKQQCLKAGMNDFISKPYTSVDISRSLEHWLPHCYQTDDINTISNSPKKETLTNTDNALISVTNALKYFQNEDNYNTYLDKFLQSCPYRLKTIDKMHQASQYHDLQQLAHSIKGEAGYLGLEELKSVCQLVQNAKPDSTINHKTKQLINTIEKTQEAIRKQLS